MLLIALFHYKQRTCYEHIYSVNGEVLSWSFHVEQNSRLGKTSQLRNNMPLTLTFGLFPNLSGEKQDNFFSLNKSTGIRFSAPRCFFQNCQTRAPEVKFKAVNVFDRILVLNSE